MIHRQRTARSAVAITELAMVLPFLLIALMICLDYGRLYQAAQIIQEAAHTGANYAAGTLYDEQSISKEDAARKHVKLITQGLPTTIADEDINVSITSHSATVRIEYRVQVFFSIYEREVKVRRHASAPIAIAIGS